MADDFGARLADDVAGWSLVSGCVNEVPNAETKNCAVGQELIEIGVREAGWLLGLMLRIDHRRGLTACAPDDVGLQQDTARLVQVMP